MDYDRKELVDWIRGIYQNLDDADKQDALRFFPALRESEEETTRKELLDFVKSFWADHKEALPQTSRWVTYLEKQKEQKSVHTAKEMWKEMRLEVYAQASGNRHEPNYSDDSTKMFSLCDIDEIFEKIGSSTVGSQPAEWSESDTLLCNAALELLRSHPNLMASHGINKSSVIRWLQSFRPQKQGFIDDICSKAGIAIPYLDGNQWCILKGDDIQSGIVGFGDTKVDALANFIKDAFIHKQNPEWSEKDEKFFELLHTALYQIKVRIGKDEYDRAVAWLKSLRPQPQKLEDWTEEDDKVYNNALDALFYKDLNNKDDVLSALKGLCDLISRKRKVIPPYSRWKPSDEQIKALGAAIVFHKNDPQIDMWRSLYDDLQKIR